jgi:hypothetical protein
VEFDRADVEHAVRGERPEPVRTHSVEINGRRYPVKQVIGKLLERKGFARIDFTSADARRLLRRLGFKLFVEQ